MSIEQNRLLNQMLEDMKEQSSLYKPTTFWQEASAVIINDINENDIKSFRSFDSSLNMFAPTYAFPKYLKTKDAFEKTKESLQIETNDVKSNLKLEMLIRGESQAFADYRVLTASNKDFPPYTDRVSESNIGTPLEQFRFDKRNFSRSFFNYLLGLSFMKQHIDTSDIKRVMEIGGGFGTLGEILLSDDRNECFYINADIPPVSFVSSYYLKELLGSKNVADYGDLKDYQVLDIEDLSKSFKALNLCSWQIPKLQGSIDLFVNFISFQEMEPDVVQNYCNYVQKLSPKYILLRNIKEGKRKQDEKFKYGVKEPIKGNDYDNFLPNYELIVTDNSIFGQKMEDNFHSQLRLYKRK